MRYRPFADRTWVNLNRFTTPLLVVCCVALLAVLSLERTEFASVERVLSDDSWGAGTGIVSRVTAFATFRPWWQRYGPNPLAVRPDGGVERIVEIPRSAIVAREGRQFLPVRGIVYDALLGAITFCRSLGSPNLVYDFGLVVRIQQWFLIFAIALAPLMLWTSHESFRTRSGLLVMTFASILVVYERPNEARFITEGIIDSALANALALLGVGAFCAALACLRLRTRREVVVAAAASLFLGLCPLVRGEFLFAFSFAYLFVACARIARDRRVVRGLALSLAIFFAVPLTYGAINCALFGHFVPLRLQSGQNLLEPIGQFANPWGIEYRDEWVQEYLAKQGIDYVSFDADAFLTRQYVEHLREDPGLFVANFRERLRTIPRQVSRRLTPLAMLLATLIALYSSYRDERFCYVSVPLAMLVGFVLFCCWFNGMFRLFTPVHFLLNVFIAYLAAYAFAIRSDVATYLVAGWRRLGITRPAQNGAGA